ncbi:MAG: geranylgeranylglycerol-phosphate geranylgeranyltransferase [Flavobacteriaceae bacterium]|nr:geranylgeranylglycerol-phosphate geranylgeranyltransferase [Flavobacteriaceae bacterium]
MQIKDYLNFFRWKNILLIILIQFLIKFVLFQKVNISYSLDHFHFALLTLSTICIAIAGYIINDIHDVEADKINKPEKVYVSKKISVQNANKLFVAFNSIGLLIGFYLSIYIAKNSFFIIFLITSLLLYRYAIDLKKRLFIGNLTVSFIVFLSILIVVIFDIVPATNVYNKDAQTQVSQWVLIISGFAFFLTLLRELIKDLEDQKGDKKINAKTLPIALGAEKTKNIIILLSLLPLFSILYFVSTLYDENLLLPIYLILCVALPLCYFIWKIKKSKAKSDYHKLSNLLKIIMLLGILSIFFI